jgi:hypothetical protein
MPAWEPARTRPPRGNPDAVVVRSLIDQAPGCPWGAAVPGVPGVPGVQTDRLPDKPAGVANKVA